MPQFRYEGYAHIFKKNEDDAGIRQGQVGTFSQADVDRYRAMGHRFTEVSGDAANNAPTEPVAPIVPEPIEGDVAPADARFLHHNAGASNTGTSSRSLKK